MRAPLVVFTLILPLLAISLAGCSSMTVKYDFIPDTEFKTYQTYAWAQLEDQTDKVNHRQFGNNPLNYQRVQHAVDNHLQARGYFKDESNPNFLVAVHGGVEDRVNIATYGYHYGYAGYWGAPYLDVYQYQEGSLIIDFVDTQTKDLFWRGWATDVVDQTADPTIKINEAVGKILAYFPPP